MQCTFILLAVLSVASMAWAQEGTPLDENKNRFVLPSQVQPKSARCKDYDYYLESPRNNGTQFIDRKYYNQGSSRKVCPEGTLFSIAADLCVCSTHVRPAFLFNRDRCVTITGSVQDSKSFSLQQRQESSTRNVWVCGYESIVRTTDNCYGSNTTVFRAIDYFNGNSVAMRDFVFTIGFRIPSGVGIGREFQIFGTSPCSGDTRQGSLVINYVTAAFNTRAVLTASFLIRDKTANAGAQETSASITCSIPPSVPSLTSQLEYVWESQLRPIILNIENDPQDPTNKLTLSADLNDFSTLSLSLTYSQMVGSGVPVGGFCQNNVVNFPLGPRGGGNMISERNCPSFFGKAPGNDYMCIYDVSLERDCQEPFVN